VHKVLLGTLFTEDNAQHFEAVEKKRKTSHIFHLLFSKLPIIGFPTYNHTYTFPLPQPDGFCPFWEVWGGGGIFPFVGPVNKRDG
jgi:hypothetical protein